MKTALRTLTLLIILGLILASCSRATEEAVLPMQATASIDRASLVNVELAVQYDTAAVYNTVNQIIRFKYIIKMMKNDLNDGTPANINIPGVSQLSCPAINTINNLDERLDAGEVLECTGDYVLTQADLDRGSVTLVTAANVYTVNSNQVTTTIPTVSSQSITLTKTSDPATYSSNGQQITFTYAITNSGAAQLGPTSFTITDPLINNNNLFNCGNADATIAPGAALTCTATYTVTANDMNATSIASTSVATGGGITSQPVSSSIAKGAATSAGTGSSIQHTVRDGEWLWQIARCYGADPQKTVVANPQVDSTSLKAGMVVTVANVGSRGTVYIKSASDLCVKFHAVQSGETWTTIADLYGSDPGLTQMVNANTLIAGKQIKVPLYTKGLGIPLIGTPATTTPPTSALGLTVTPSSTTYGQAGQSITFNYVIKNNGTTTLGPTQFTINDAFMNPAVINCGDANATIAPGASITCSAPYLVSETNMNAVDIVFSTKASGAGATDSAVVSTKLTKSVAQITLSITPTPTTYSQEGQVITLTYIIKNTGASALGPTQFTISSQSLNPPIFNCEGPSVTLEPGANITCSSNYTISQLDMGAVNIEIVATASGGGVASQPASALVTRQ
jgi:hypothetical protein